MRSPWAGDQMRSVREIARQPSARCARSAMSCARLATASGTRAGQISSDSPESYFAR